MSEPLSARISWEKHGDVWLMIARGWKRVFLFLEGSQYHAVGILGTGQPLKEKVGANRRTLMRLMELEYRKEYPA